MPDGSTAKFPKSAEIAGLAKVRREIIADRSTSDCPTLGAWTDTSYWLAQTVDLAGEMANLAMILRIIPSHPDSPATCMFTFTGFVDTLA